MLLLKVKTLPFIILLYVMIRQYFGNAWYQIKNILDTSNFKDCMKLPILLGQTNFIQNYKAAFYIWSCNACVQTNFISLLLPLRPDKQDCGITEWDLLNGAQTQIVWWCNFYAAVMQPNIQLRFGINPKPLS